MIHYKLAKELKDAGFQQTGNGNYSVGDIEADEGGIVTNNSAYIPTLSELIDACINRTFSLDGTTTEDRNIEWIAETVGGKETSKTPKEAVAKLWLKLHDKK